MFLVRSRTYGAHDFFFDTHQEKQKDDGRRLQVRAESQQTAIAILHHELALVPGHVAKSPSEFHALGGVLGIKCVGIFAITPENLHDEVDFGRPVGKEAW
jgi:hypothetical protein